MDPIVISSVSGLVPYLIGGAAVAIIWGVKTHFKFKASDAKHSSRLDALEKDVGHLLEYKADHQKESTQNTANMAVVIAGIDEIKDRLDHIQYNGAKK